MSAPAFHEVRFEIVRPGKSHNQLLSPLTPYMALCGEGSPTTFHVDFEHHQLLSRLERLRYVTKTGERFTAIPPRLRETEIGDIGNEVARIFGNVQTLSTELSRAQGDNKAGATDVIVHLRIVLFGSELSLIPFETAIAPMAYPGEGLEFCLQASLPIVVTREIRRGYLLPPSWNRSSRTAPKVLLVYAEPEGMKVPAKAHIQAMRAALEPWVRRTPQKDRTGDAQQDHRQRLGFVKDRLRLLPDASIEDIYRLCSEENFTHVHILAHGDTYQHAGETRFGVALCRKGSAQAKEVVSGKRLAKALQAESAGGAGRSEPLMVTLATCDSGNQTTVMVPGGSIAHDLHVEGIPWVFASQFPLTVSGSVRMTEILYPRLFRGDDPRQALFELRRQLYQSAQNDHDWASLVAYATLPHDGSPGDSQSGGLDFNAQVAEFCASQIKEAINVCLESADRMIVQEGVGRSPQAQDEIRCLIAEVEEWLRVWRSRKPSGGSEESRLRRAAEISGIHGSTYKRVALLLDTVRDDKENVQRYYRKSLEYYRAAMKDAVATGVQYYWAATQYLSMQAICGETADRDAYELARRVADRDTRSEDNDVRAWAYATLAELELLSTYHAAREASSKRHAAVADRVEGYCREIGAIKGPRSFHAGSTMRQFKRYRDHWANPRWDEIAQRAIEVFAPKGAPEPEFDYPDA